MHQAGSVREARSWISYGGSGPGASPGAAQRRPAALRKRDQAGSDAGQSAGSVHRYPENPGGRLQRPQHQNANAARESQTETGQSELSNMVLDWVLCVVCPGRVAVLLRRT